MLTLVYHVDGPSSVAYREDVVTKRTAGYRIGDKIEGATIETINRNKVVIRGSNGLINLSMRDPSRPRRAASEAAPVSVTQPVLPVFSGVLSPDTDIAKSLRPPPRRSVTSTRSSVSSPNTGRSRLRSS